MTQWESYDLLTKWLLKLLIKDKLWFVGVWNGVFSLKLETIFEEKEDYRIFPCIKVIFPFLQTSGLSCNTKNRSLMIVGQVNCCSIKCSTSKMCPQAHNSKINKWGKKESPIIDSWINSAELQIQTPSHFYFIMLHLFAFR